MITGWEVMDDDEVKDIVTEAVEEAGMKIKPVDEDNNEEGHDKIKSLVIEALKETEEKVDNKKLKGQKGDHHLHDLIEPKPKKKKKD